MTEIITILNQRKGVGKTTTAVNLAASLALKEKKVILIDLDSKADATKFLGFHQKEYKMDISYLLENNEIQKDEIVLNTKIKYLDLIPATENLLFLEEKLEDKEQLIYLKKNILRLIKVYDYIIIDLPSVFGNLTFLSLIISSSVIIPIKCENLDFKLLLDLLNVIRNIKQKNMTLKIRGILPTMYFADKQIKKNLSELIGHFSKKMFFDKKKNSNKYLVIPKNDIFNKVSKLGKPLLLYDIKNSATISYQKLANLIVEE